MTRLQSAGLSHRLLCRGQRRRVLSVCAAASASPRVVGFGSLCQDMLVFLPFPTPDAKVRAERTVLQGGGNASNSLVAASRLGAKCSLWTKVGDDATGVGLLREMAFDGVDCSAVCVAPSSVSPFTYIIVDEAAATRTCIHTPGSSAAVPSDLRPDAVHALLSGASLVAFDGRLADVALQLADAAVSQSIPVLVEAERPRDGLAALLLRADAVITSTRFPAAFTGQDSLADALATLAVQLPRARLVVTTLGGGGCVALERVVQLDGTTGNDDGGIADTLEAAMASLFPPPHLAPSAPLRGGGARPIAANARTHPRHVRLRHSESGAGTASHSSQWRVHAAPAAALPGPAVDTTGAGDAFIGAMAFWLASTGWLCGTQSGAKRAADDGGGGVGAALRLACWVAAANCCAAGARGGMPRRADVPPELLPGYTI